MLARLSRLTTVLAIALAAWGLAAGAEYPAWAGEPAESAGEASAGNGHPTSTPNAAPLPIAANHGYPVGGFNYYVHPGEAGLVGAQLYVCPRPTPPLVGHTYITYPPLMPHEFLYRHHRVYHTYNAGSGWTRTRARWN